MSEEPAPPSRELPKWLVVGLLWLWLAVLALTHWGDRSPYSYGWAMFYGKAAYLNGAVVNPDAPPLHAVALFFYEAAPPDWAKAQNMRLPIHAFSTAVVASFTGSYLLSSYIVNYLFAALLALVAVNFAETRGVRRKVTLVVLLTAFSLPIFVEYLGQPVQYIVGPAVSFLIILAVMALEPRDARDPWIAGLATTILTLNYDPYVFLTALVAYFLFVSGFPRFGHYLVYVVAAAVPNILWSIFLRLASAGTMSEQLRQQFFIPVMNAWTGFLANPIDHILQPFVASHVGLHVAFHQTIALIPWPMLLVCAYLLLRLRPSVGHHKPAILAAMLPVFYVLEQMGTALWDFELNPRRAIPVVLAFALSYCWVANQTWSMRRWRFVFVVLLALGGTLAMADTIFKSPVIAFLHTGQSVRMAPHEAERIEKLRLDPKSMPTLMRNENPVIWRDLGTARLRGGGLRRTKFAFSQLFMIGLVCGLFWLVSRARLLPRWAPVGVGGVWAASLIARFI